MDKKTIAGKQGKYTEMTSRGFAPGSIRRPHMSAMFEDAYLILQNELSALKALAATEKGGLSLADTKRMGIVMDQMAKLGREEREQTRDDRLNEKTDAELAAMAKTALRVVGSNE